MSGSPRPGRTRLAGRVLPGLVMAALVALGRWWHVQGAAHSVPDALLVGGLAAACALVAVVSTAGRGGSAVITGAALGTAGVLVVLAVAGYAHAVALPLALALVWAGGWYALGALHQRSEATRQAEHERTLQLRQLELNAAVHLEHLRTQHALAMGGGTTLRRSPRCLPW